MIFGSWCGKKFRPENVAARAGWGDVPAVRAGHLYEVKSSIILQPGPAALTDGLAELHRRLASWAEGAGPGNRETPPNLCRSAVFPVSGPAPLKAEAKDAPSGG